MATIMERIGLLARTGINELREKYEDPEKAVNEAIADAMVTYTDLKRDAAEVFEGEAQARARVESLTDEAERWYRVARKALAAGNEADARHALSRRQDLLDRLKGPRELYDQAHQVAETFHKRLAELEDGISRLQAKVALINAREATVRATEAAGEVSESSTSAGAQKLRERENESAWDLAEAEGNAEAQRVAASDPFEQLERELAAQKAAGMATAAKSDVDAALAALKTQVEEEEPDADDDGD